LFLTNTFQLKDQTYIFLPNILQTKLKYYLFSLDFTEPLASCFRARSLSYPFYIDTLQLGTIVRDPL